MFKKIIIITTLLLSTLTFTACSNAKQTSVDTTEPITELNTEISTQAEKNTITQTELATEPNTQSNTETSTENNTENQTKNTTTPNNSSQSNSSSNSGNTENNNSNNNSGNKNNNQSSTTSSKTSTNTNSSKTNSNSSKPNTNNNNNNNTSSKKWYDAEYKYINHPAETKQVWIVDQKAYTYEEPIYEYQSRTICGICGADITGNVRSHGIWHDDRGENFNYSTKQIQVQTGNKTITVPEKGHYETKIIKEAWTEKILVREAGYY